MQFAQERRKTDRVVLSPPLRGRVGDHSITMVDLGALGARIRHEEPIEINGPTRLTFDWEGEEVAVECRIVRAQANPEMEIVSPNIFESGLQFDDPLNQSDTRFRRVLQRLGEREEIEHLKTLVEASKMINSSIEAEQLFVSILAVARQELGVERGTLYFVDEARQEIWAKFADGAGEIRLPIGRGLAGSVAATGEPVILHDAYADPRFDSSTDLRSGYRTRSMLCVPIRIRGGKTVGVLQLLNKMKGSFGEADLRFLDAISDHMAIAIDNARLHLDLIEKNRMERELQLGREIQSRLLPAPPSDVARTALAAMSLPCYEVGGDYYDFIELPDGDIGLAIGDVSGKGVAAALIMSSMQAALRIAAPIESDLERLVARLNGLLYRMARGRKYVTFFFGRFNPKSGELRYVNAGHNPPFVINGDLVTRLASTGKPIGLLPDIPFEERTVNIPPGASLVLYTDGLNEAANSAEEEFGNERLESLVLETSADVTEEMPRRILDAITAFEAGAHATDDKTIVVVRRT